MAQAAQYDLQRDFSIRANPNGVWSYGALPASGGPLTLLRVNGVTSDDRGLPLEYWQIAPSVEPTFFHNANTVTALSCFGQCVFPPGTVWITPGPAGNPHDYALARLTVPTNAAGNYQLMTQVEHTWNGPVGGDAEFRVTRNGVELHRAVLTAEGKASYSALLPLAGGDTIDFMVGRGPDGSPIASGLKVQAVIAGLGTEPPPPAELYEVARGFSRTANPNGPWSYGSVGSIGGAFTRLAVAHLSVADNGVRIPSWQLSSWQVPAVYCNDTTNTAVYGGGQGSAGPGTVWFHGGENGRAENYGVIRFTAPSNGVWQVETAVGPVYNGSLQGDTDFHVVRNGQEVFGRNLAAGARTNFSGSMSLGAGDTVDFVIGRGADGDVSGSGLKVAAALRWLGAACAPSPEGLVAWWSLEGNATDVVGTNAGSLSGQPEFVAGGVGRALRFDGRDDFVRMPAAPALDVGAGMGLTIEVWIRPADLSQLRPIVEWNDGAGRLGAHVWTSVDTQTARDGRGSLFANLVDTTGTAHQIRTPARVLRANAWQHVALTYDKTSGQAALYLDGSSAAQTNLGTFTPRTTGALYLGTRPSGPFAGIFWQGDQDEVSLYNRALSQSEIAAIHGAGAAGKCARPGQPPRILTQPRGATVLAGTNYLFTVLASGAAPLTYTWKFNQTILASGTTNTLFLSNVQRTNTGWYAVTVSNHLGMVRSAPAQLQVLVPPNPPSEGSNALQIASCPLPLPEGGMELTFQGTVATEYVVERSSDLVSWTRLTNVVVTADGPHRLIDSTTPPPLRSFYRVRPLP